MDTLKEKNGMADANNPGSMSSFNNREDNRQGAVEDVKEEKDVDESYLDYNGNSEANAPARTRDGE